MVNLTCPRGSVILPFLAWKFCLKQNYTRLESVSKEGTVPRTCCQPQTSLGGRLLGLEHQPLSLARDDITPSDSALPNLCHELRLSSSLYRGEDRQVSSVNEDETKHVSSALKMLPVHPFPLWSLKFHFNS